MERRHALVALTIASIAVLGACLVAGAAAGVVLAACAAAFPPLLMAVGAAGREGRLGPVIWPIALLLVALEACFVGMLALAGEVESAPWVLGLPAAAALQIYGVLLVPQLLVALGYALTFDAFGVSDRDLEELRELGRRPPGGGADEPDGG